MIQRNSRSTILSKMALQKHFKVCSLKDRSVYTEEKSTQITKDTT